MARQPGLRERKKAATMRHVQAVALDMFEADGFDVVSIERVAEAAEVSPSTVYRYFGTKEGLVVHDEYDDRLLDAFRRGLADGLGLAECASSALEDIWREHFVDDAGATERRARLCFEVPAIQGAMSLALNDQVDAIAGVVADSGRMSFPRARIAASAMVWAVIGAMRNWFDAGCSADMADLREGVEEAFSWLRLIEGGDGAR